MDYEIIKIDEQTWRIEDAGVRFFLLEGSKKALLIDSGMTVHNAREIAASLTDLPVELLNTHADIDHIGSNKEFDTVYMNPAEYNNYSKHVDVKRLTEITPVWDGDILDLGERPIQIITQPGHTPGSIALLDGKRRVLFGADSIQDGNIFMFGPQRNLPAYLHSLKKMKRYENQFDTIYPSHGTFPLPAGVIQELIDGVEKLLRKEIPSTSASFKGMELKAYHIGAAGLLCDSDAPY